MSLLPRTTLHSDSEHFGSYEPQIFLAKKSDISLVISLY